MPKNATLEHDLHQSRRELKSRSRSLAQSSLELELSREKYVDLYDDAPVCFLTLTRSGLIHEVNLPGSLLLGKPRAHLAGCPFMSFIAKADQKKFLSHLSRARQSRELANPFSIELELVIRGREKPLFIELISTPTAGKRAECALLRCILIDVTQRRQNEEELKRARDEAQRANQAKDNFLAALSHELRTPLNPVLLVASDYANDPELSPQLRLIFDMIRRNVELEARLIDDLLDLTRITRGKLSLVKEVQQGHEILEETIVTLQSELDEKKLVLKTGLAATNDTIIGDAVRLQQIFWNVLRNAVKFTPAGGTITIATSNTDQNEFLVSITDTGIGMTQHELAHIFEAFRQGDHATARSAQAFGGLGIGLTISRQLVESHFGKIEATSKGRDCGSSFTIRLPLALEDAQARPAVSPPIPLHGVAPSTPQRILLVEDHNPTRNALETLLVRRRFKVQAVGSVREAKEALKANEFDLLISDIGLPDGDGLQLMHESHEAHGLKGIALTGYGTGEDIERSHVAGFTTHLTKPVKIELLEQALATAFCQAPCCPAPAATHRAEG